MNAQRKDALRVNGEAEVGHFVVYADTTNQTGEVFVVTSKPVGNGAYGYGLRSTETGLPMHSELKEGWAFV